MLESYMLYRLALVGVTLGVIFLTILLVLGATGITRRFDSKELTFFRIIVAVLLVTTFVCGSSAWDLHSDGINDELTMITETVSNRKIVSVDTEITRSQYRDEQTVDVNGITYIDESNEEATMQLFFTQAWILPSEDDSYHIAVSDDEQLTIYKPTVMISE